MATNPLVSQGTLNRLRGSIVYPNFPALNVTAPFLGREGIRLALQGQASTQINTMTGAVQSPEPYMAVTITLALLKTQNLSDVYKKQMETNALLGDCTVRPDTPTLSPYQFSNVSIADVPELSLAGDTPDYRITLTGYYNINSDLWNL